MTNDVWSLAVSQSCSELGCGTGVVGLSAAGLGGEVVLTDLPVYIPSVMENIQANLDTTSRTGGSVSAAPLDWREEVPPSLRAAADLVLVCDCIYYEASLTPLIDTILSLTKRDTKVILAYEERPDKLQLYEEFFSVLHKHFSSRELRREETGANCIYLLELSLLK